MPCAEHTVKLRKLAKVISQLEMKLHVACLKGETNVQLLSCTDHMLGMLACQFCDFSFIDCHGEVGICRSA